MSAAIVECGSKYGAVVKLLHNEISENVKHAAGRSRMPGMKVILNAATARRYSDDLKALVDLLAVNRLEACQMTGTALADDVEAEAAALQSAQRRTSYRNGWQGWRVRT